MCPFSPLHNSSLQKNKKTALLAHYKCFACLLYKVNQSQNWLENWKKWFSTHEIWSNLWKLTRKLEKLTRLLTNHNIMHSSHLKSINILFKEEEAVKKNRSVGRSHYIPLLVGFSVWSLSIIHHWTIQKVSTDQSSSRTTYKDVGIIY